MQVRVESTGDSRVSHTAVKHSSICVRSRMHGPTHVWTLGWCTPGRSQCGHSFLQSCLRARPGVQMFCTQCSCWALGRLPYAAVPVYGSALCECSTAAVCGEATHSCNSLVRMQFTQHDDDACTSSCATLQPHTGLRRHNLPCICLFMPECLCLTEAAGGWSVSAPAWYECGGARFRDKRVTRQPAAPQLLRWPWLQPAPDGAAPAASPVPPSTLWCRLAGPADAAAACGAKA